MKEKKSKAQKVNEIVTYLAENNSVDYNMDKAVEEMSELITEIVQNRTKPSRDNSENLLEELGHAKFRLEILARQLDPKAVNKSIYKKAKQCKKNIKSGRYVNS